MVSLDQFLNTDPITFLENLQGNILKGHGRAHTRHLLFRLQTDDKLKYAARNWLAHFARTRVTSALQQHLDAVAHKQGKGREQLFAMVLLTATGYEALYFDHEKMFIPGDESFLQGTAGRLPKDPPSEEWEPPYSNQDKKIHAMILLAHEDPIALDKEAANIQEELSEFIAGNIHVEKGRRIYNAEGSVIEHFGYVDGISQPLFIQQEINAYREKYGGTLRWDPATQLSEVLTEEYPGSQTYGSYMVFRKLEQNVAEFRRRFNKESGLEVIGRYPDGTPLIPSRKGGNNNFNYEGPDQTLCPVTAHIRTVNARKAEWPKLVRRGITYGNRQADGADSPEQGVGLLFMSFQDAIQQFELLQNWADGVYGNGHADNVDALIARNADPEATVLVKLKGSMYCFAPSISNLQELATLKPERRRAFKSALSELLRNETTLSSFKEQWLNDNPIGAFNTVDLSGDDFYTLYSSYSTALTEPEMRQGRVGLFAAAGEPLPTQCQEEPDSESDPLPIEKLANALESVLNPEILETFIALWPNDPTKAMALVGLTPKETVNLYNYLCKKAGLGLPWPWWL